jgi:hypothetical protein
MKHENFKNFSTRRSEKSVRIDYAKVKKAFIICRSLDQKLHQRILSFFEEKEIFSEGEIANKIRLKLDVTQEHLRVMVRAKILNVFWQDTEKCYTANEQRLAAIRKFYTDLND